MANVCRETIEKEQKGHLEDTFSYVNPVPMATASVAQVHEAILKASNKEVVIKVLKPGVEDILTTDLSFLYLTVKCLQFVNPELERSSLVDIVGVPSFFIHIYGRVVSLYPQGQCKRKCVTNLSAHR